MSNEQTAENRCTIMSYIFISYVREDWETAQKFASALETQGYNVWWDRSIPAGRVFVDIIEAAIDAAACVLVLWSNHSVNSDWVKTEAGEGANRGILVPVKIEVIKPPLRFRQYHSAEMITWQGDTAHPSFQKLLQSINRHVKPDLNRDIVYNPQEKKQRLELQNKLNHHVDKFEGQPLKNPLLSLELIDVTNRIHFVVGIGLVVLLSLGLILVDLRSKTHSITSGSEIIDAVIIKSLNKKKLAENDIENLTYMDLSNTKITYKDLQCLKLFSRLELLDLSNTGITDEDLRHLKQLNSLIILDLSKTEITDAGLLHLNSFSNLQTIDFNETNISDEASNWFKQTHPGLEIVRIVVINDDLISVRTLDLSMTKSNGVGLQYPKPGIIFVYTKGMTTVSASPSKLQLKRKPIVTQEYIVSYTGRDILDIFHQHRSKILHFSNQPPHRIADG